MSKTLLVAADQPLLPMRTPKALERARDAAHQTWLDAKETVLWLDDAEGGELLATAQGAVRQAWTTYDALVQATGKVTSR